MKELVLGILIENVVDDLDGVDEAGEDGTNAVRGFPAVEAEAEGADFAAGSQFLDGARDTLIVDPGVFPSMELNEVKRFDAKIFQALVDVLENVVGRIAFIESVFGTRRPAAVFWRNLCGNANLLVRATAARDRVARMSLTRDLRRGRVVRYGKGRCDEWDEKDRQTVLAAGFGVHDGGCARREPAGKRCE